MDNHAVCQELRARIAFGMTFEIVPVVPSKETREVVAPFLDQK